MNRLLALLVLFGTVLFGSIAEAAQLTDAELREAGLLAVQEDGRRKPLDTFAKESMLFLTGRPKWEAFGKKWKPLDFVLSALLEDRDWKNEKLILVQSYALKQQLKLDPKRTNFSLEELGTNQALIDLARVAHEKQVAEETLTPVEKEVETVGSRISLFQKILSGDAMLIVPPDKDENAQWVVPPKYSLFYTDAAFAPAANLLQSIAKAYVDGDGFNFAKSARELRQSLRALSPNIYPDENVLVREYFYNHLDAFKWATVCFILGTLCIGGVVLTKSSESFSLLRVAALVAGVVGVILQTVGIVLRCMIAGRPPVTNMYESVIWVSFVVAVLGLIFYLIYRSDLYLLAAMPVSAISVLLVLQMPSAMPSHIDPLVPVLRDNFWLTIHVLTIAMGYAAFALAMAFGHIVLGMYAMKPEVTRANLPLHFWLYRVIQLGVLLLGAGTILGGVWANYSWGRFWGWDPKETWALIALLSYIVALHGRIGGWWNHFGMAVASVVCFLTIIMAWYGVNFVLGAGLHSYGFGAGGEPYIYSFVVFDALFVAFASWRYLSARKRGGSGGGGFASEEPEEVQARLRRVESLTNR